MKAEIGLDAWRQLGLSSGKGFVEHDQRFVQRVTILIGQSLLQQRIGGIKNVLAEVYAQLVPDLN